MNSRIFDVPIFYLPPDDFPGAAARLHYNKAIGYIWLAPRLDAVRAEYCLARERPSPVLVKRTFEDCDKLFQVTCQRLSHAAILAKRIGAFQAFQQVGELSRFWIDLRSLRDMGRYIDWRALVSCSAPDHSFKADASDAA
jgi:hypothetical protein